MPGPYGAMLIEGLLAVIALSTVKLLPYGDALTLKPPQVIYHTSISRFLFVFGIHPSIGFFFGLLAIATFILTFLDTATRLGHYIFEEFFGLSDGSTRYFHLGHFAIASHLFVDHLRGCSGCAPAGLESHLVGLRSLQSTSSRTGFIGDYRLAEAERPPFLVYGLAHGVHGGDDHLGYF